MTGQGLWEGQTPSSSSDLERKLLIGFCLMKGRRENWNQPFWIINELPQHGPNSIFLHIHVHFSSGFHKTSSYATYTWKETVNSFKTTWRQPVDCHSKFVYVSYCVTLNNINVTYTFKYTYIYIYVFLWMCVYSYYVNYGKWVKDAINCLCYYYVSVCTTEAQCVFPVFW